MKDNVLIVGYGRAGKRHEKLAREIGLQALVYDPLVFPWQLGTIGATFSRMMVICTPPESHLEYITWGLQREMAILCEKPLCSLGQLERAREVAAMPGAEKVMVAYNYRYHPKLQPLRGQVEVEELYCSQYRVELPPWGLLLDHVSHDLDIVRQVSRTEIKIREAWHNPRHDFDEWTIILVGDEMRIISELVWSDNPARPRIARLHFWPPGGDYLETINIDPDPEMFRQMWAAFLAGPAGYDPGLAEAIKTQELLEMCHAQNI